VTLITVKVLPEKAAASAGSGFCGGITI